MDANEHQKRHWNSVAGGWDAWSDWTTRNFSPIADWFRDNAGWKPGARILDVACGCGFPMVAAAQSVLPGGAVVATDISPEMLAMASRRAEANGLDNIRFVEMDAEDLKFEDAEFDTVTNAYGLMFCADPSRAVGNAYRVLKSGGRLAAVTWDDPSSSPFFSVIFSAAAPFLSFPPPDAAAPGPFRLTSPAELESLLLEGGFADVRVETVEMTCELASAAEYLQVFSDLAWKAKVAALSRADLTCLREAIATVTEPYVIDGRIRVRAASLCVSGHR
jgi:ubiquinone/menaquinone biosynthesis C-methylase UbiE